MRNDVPVPYKAELRSEFVQGRNSLYGLAALGAQKKGLPRGIDPLVPHDGGPDRGLVRRLSRTRANGAANGAAGSGSRSPENA